MTVLPQELFWNQLGNTHIDMFVSKILWVLFQNSLGISMELEFLLRWFCTHLSCTYVHTCFVTSALQMRIWVFFNSLSYSSSSKTEGCLNVLVLLCVLSSYWMIPGTVVELHLRLILDTSCKHTGCYCLIIFWGKQLLEISSTFEITKFTLVC